MADSFMFQLNADEFLNLKSQNVTSSWNKLQHENKRGKWEMENSYKKTIFAGLIIAFLMVMWLANNWGVFAAEKKPAMANELAMKSGLDYKDVNEGVWYFDALFELSKAGVISGYPDGTFMPNKTVTFGEMIKMMTAAKEMAGANLNSIGDSDERSSNNISAEPNANWATAAYNQGLAQGLFTKWDIESDDLAKPIPRKYMALIIGSALGDRTITDYVGLRETIQDIRPGDQFEFEMMKAYDAEILNGYPDGSFGPNKTLTRAEAATAVYRFVSQQTAGSGSVGQGETVWPQAGQDQASQGQAGLLPINQLKPSAPLPLKFVAGPADDYWAKDPDYPAMEAWYNGSNITTHSTNTYWLENKSFKPQVRGQFRLEAGKLRMTSGEDGADGEDGGAAILSERQQASDGWILSGKSYKNVNEDVYKVLKAYWNFAAKEDFFITISGGQGLSYDAISIVLSERDGPNFPRTSSFCFNDGKAPLMGSVQPFVVFDLGMNYRLSELEALVRQSAAGQTPAAGQTAPVAQNAATSQTAAAGQTSAAGAPDWRDEFLGKGRILSQPLYQLNKNLLMEIYGQSRGGQIYDFAIEKYKKLYAKDEQGAFLRLINLGNAGKIIEGVSVYFNDDATSRTTLYIGQH